MNEASLFEAWFDGRSVTGLSPRVLLTGIEEPAPQLSFSAAADGRGLGRRLTGSTREALRVGLTLRLAEPDPPARSALLDRLRAWCGGGAEGWLQLSTRPGRRLRCRAVRLPGLSAWHWLEPVPLWFEAWQPPCWESAQSVTAALGPAGRALETVFRCGGTLETPLGFTVWAAEPVTELTLRCGAGLLRLTGLSLAAGGSLTGGVDDRGLFFVRQGETSVLGCVAPESSDLLTVPAQSGAPVSVAADGAVTAVIRARPRWL